MKKYIIYPKKITFDTILDFGKYKGYKIKEMFSIDIPYLMWLTFVTECEKSLEKEITEQYEQLKEIILKNQFEIY